MNTALGNIIAAAIWMVDAVLGNFFVVTGGYINATSDDCLAQTTVAPTACGELIVENLSNLFYQLTALGGEIFSALGVAPGA